MSALAQPIELGGVHRIHVVGIGGAGMSAIAVVLVEMGHRVTGSDAAPSATIDRLRVAGVDARVGHHAANLPDGIDLVAVSTAIPPSNPEVVEAERRGIPVVHRAELLAAICATRQTIAVSGTHGKTTTSSLLAEILVGAGRDPGFIIGAEVRSLGAAARWGGGAEFVVEADESDGSGFAIPRSAAILTNVEPDHLEHHGGFEQLRAGFDRFVSETSGVVVICADDPIAAELAAAHRATSSVRTYGLAAGSDYRMVDPRLGRETVTWAVERDGARIAEPALALPGLHNATNATGALAVAAELGVEPTAAVAALATDRGVARRFEVRGTARGVTFVDDYAHLPSEVAATVAAARAGGWSRVVAVFQPHRYSRTQALAPTFADAFRDADVVVVTDVYPAGEARREGVSGRLVADAVAAAHPSLELHYVAELGGVVDWLDAELREGDLCLTLGAGDLTTVPSLVLARWG